MTTTTSPAGQSNALVRKSTDTELMPPPPVKRIKRPPKVLDEDSYTDAISEIIARDFFPGLLETKHQQEYLDALESQDSEWIAEASRKLTEVMRTPQGRRRGTSFATPRYRDAATPVAGAAPGAATPSESRKEEEKAPERPDMNFSLDAFQAKYTSEDNASFNDLLDKQNEKRRKAYAFLWNGNHIPGFRSLAYMKRLKAQEEEKQITGDVKLITAPDNRPAVPNTWKTEARNGLMFTPDKSPPPPEKDEKERELPPKAVVYPNTRMPPPAPSTQERPSSPTSTEIADAISGHPRLTESEPGFGTSGAETPRVNGYSFVDDAPSPSPSELGPPPLTWGAVSSISETSSAPFKLKATSKRELLHHKMVEKVAKNKRATNPLLGAAKTPGASPRMTPLGGGGKGRQIPRFGSSPALTPAGQRLWGNLTGRREAGLREVLGKRKQTGTPVAAGQRPFRWDPTPKVTDKGKGK